MRTGWYREARVKGWAAHAVRHLVNARSALVGISTDLSNQIRSVLKTFGLRARGRAGGVFEAKVRGAMAERPEVAAVVEPLLTVWRTVRDGIAGLDRRIMAAAKDDPTCRLLMTCPGVGAVIATSFSAAVEAPGHFRGSHSVGAYLDLTPRRHQSGEMDHSAGVSKRGDKLLRSYLFEAASCLLVRVQRASALKASGLALVQRLGFKRAAVAVARKISVVLHVMWKANTPFQAWPGLPTAPTKSRSSRRTGFPVPPARRTKASPPGRDADHPAVGLAAGRPDRALYMERSRLEAHGAAASRADRENNHDPAAMQRQQKGIDQPSRDQTTTHLWRPRRVLLSMPRLAMRGVIPRARHSRRQRRWS